MINVFETFPILDLLSSNFINDLKKIKKFKEDTSKNLDFLAKKYYNNVNYWWIIALYNNIVDPFDINKDIIRIPDLFEVENLYIEYRLEEMIEKNNK